MSGRIVFVVNPQSAAGKTLRMFERLRPILRRRLGDFDVALTTRPLHATALSADALDAGAAGVVAVGGDGTNNEVVNGFFDDAGNLRNPDAKFGTMTSGTGGDFRRTFGWDLDPERAVGRIADGQTKNIDIGELTFVNHDGAEARRYFLNIASLGLTGAVDAVVNAAPKRFGAKVAFIGGTLRAFAGYSAPRVVLTDDSGRVVDQTMQLAAVCNGKYFGGGMMIGPDADPLDGEFTVVTVAGTSKSFWLKHAPKVYSGRHVALDEVTCWNTTALTAEAPGGEEVLLDVDGEQPGRLPARFRILPGAIPLWS